MNTSTDQEKNQVLLETLRQTVEKLEDRLGYKPQGLDPQEQDRLETLIDNAKRMRRFIEPSDS